MAQHFLLSAAARTLSLKTIFSEGEDAAYRRFRRLRWPETDGAPVCPVCGCLDIYDLTTRRRFKCAACHHQFSVTSGTILASRKLSFVDLLGCGLPVCERIEGALGGSTLPRPRRPIQDRLRADAQTARGDGCGDAGYAAQRPCGSGRRRLRRACPPRECRKDRVDRRLLRNRSGKRRVVVALRQRGGSTLTRTFPREAEGVGFARERIAPGSTISADEIAHWDRLEPGFNVHRINHSDAYSRDGVHTNLAESFFARLRRMVGGQHHKVGGRLLGAYAAHAAWLEDHRGQGNGALADRLIGKALAAPVSRTWKGYWRQRVA